MSAGISAATIISPVPFFFAIAASGIWVQFCLVKFRIKLPGFKPNPVGAMITVDAWFGYVDSS
jgi:hypothetical protein